MKKLAKIVDEKLHTVNVALGDDISLAEPEVQLWISEYLKEQYDNR